jgi:hypothetical protein
VVANVVVVVVVLQLLLLLLLLARVAVLVLSPLLLKLLFPNCKYFSCFADFGVGGFIILILKYRTL